MSRQPGYQDNRSDVSRTCKYTHRTLNTTSNSMKSRQYPDHALQRQHNHPSIPNTTGNHFSHHAAYLAACGRPWCQRPCQDGRAARQEVAARPARPSRPRRGASLTGAVAASTAGHALHAHSSAARALRRGMLTEVILFVYVMMLNG